MFTLLRQKYLNQAYLGLMRCRTEACCLMRDAVYQYKENYYRAMDINETEGLEFMGYNLKEEMYKNMLTTKSVYVRLFTNADFKLYKGLDLGSKIPV